MGCASSHTPLESVYASILPNTEDVEKGLGSIYRCPGYEKEFYYQYDPEVVSLYDNFLTGMKRFPNGGYLGYRPIVDGKAQDYVWKTYTECYNDMNSYAKALQKHDLLSVTDGSEKRSDGTPIATIGHFTKNCVAAVISQFSVWKLNGTVVTLYETLGPEAIATICAETELKTILCTPASGMVLLRSMKDDLQRFSSVKNLIIDGIISEEMRKEAKQYNVSLYCYDDLVKEGESLPDIVFPKAQLNDVCMICYTSGTTGTPKGAILTHGNFIAVTVAVVQYINTIGGFMNEDIYISYLPMAHVFEHFVQCSITYYGSRIGFGQGDTTKIVSDIKTLRPTLFASVPRLMNRITDSIFNKVKQSPAYKQALFTYAYNSKKDRLMKENTPVYPFWDNLVFKSVKETIGLDRIRFMVTGSAPISDDCLQALRIIFGCPVVQGLGLTETGGGICCSYMHDYNTFGHCGGIICGSEARVVSVKEMNYLVTDKFHGREVDADGTVINEGIACKGRGECCYRGHNIIRGYYKRPDINKEVFDEDGWYHSGDIGIWLPNGAIRIVDRKKDIFKLAQGEYISPDKVTAVYQHCPVVGSLFVYGDSFQSYLVAIVVPEEEILRKLCRDRGMTEADLPFDRMCLDPSVRAVVYEEMCKVADSSNLMGFEKIKNIFCDNEAWTVENGMLTPTLKLKREMGKSRYRKAIDSLYAEGVMKIRSD